MAKQPDPAKVKVLKRIKINKTLISGDKKVTRRYCVEGEI